MSDDKTHAGALAPGVVISSGQHRYRVEKVLGAGGFGITYKVERLSDGRVFAMKEYFRKELCERDDNHSISYLKSNRDIIENGLDDFITEARRLDRQNIAHPNIVAIYEVFKANNTAYYVMEFVPGDDLLRYIRKHKDTPLTEQQALSVIRPVLQAVALLHRNRITHLDIKHENIILTRQDDGSLRPVLIDFGLSKHYDKKGKATSELTAAGCTDGFAPQEQYLGLTTFTPQADVYALGATMLYLLTAKWPVKSSEISARKIIDALPEGVSERVQDALVKSLRRDKEDRTQSVEKFAEELGLDIADHHTDGNATYLLELGRRRRTTDYSRYLKPALLALGVCALLAGGVLLVKNIPSSGSGNAGVEAADSVAMYAEEVAADSLNQTDVAQVVDDMTASGNESDGSGKVSGEEEARKPEPKEPEMAKPEPVPGLPSAPADNLDAQFAAARTLDDFKALAAKGYVKAYAPLAEKYFQGRQYKMADQYVRLAAAAGSGTAQAKRVAETLKAAGYYDDPSVGSYPF
ncbi:serine/threonine protein kinase [Muribaculaceae bacterium Isolate-013 (NCI)]|nr:serine/threonine protein kinase [Muribaculaceae bacterium Isolate-013 (NCI)]